MGRGHCDNISGNMGLHRHVPHDLVVLGGKPAEGWALSMGRRRRPVAGHRTSASRHDRTSASAPRARKGDLPYTKPRSRILRVADCPSGSHAMSELPQYLPLVLQHWVFAAWKGSNSSVLCLLGALRAVVVMPDALRQNMFRGIGYYPV